MLLFTCNISCLRCLSRIISIATFLLLYIFVVDRVLLLSLIIFELHRFKSLGSHSSRHLLLILPRLLLLLLTHEQPILVKFDIDLSLTSFNIMLYASSIRCLQTRGQILFIWSISFHKTYFSCILSMIISCLTCFCRTTPTNTLLRIHIEQRAVLHSGWRWSRIFVVFAARSRKRRPFRQVVLVLVTASDLWRVPVNFLTAVDLLENKVVVKFLYRILVLQLLRWSLLIVIETARPKVGVIIWWRIVFGHPNKSRFSSLTANIWICIVMICVVMRWGCRVLQTILRVVICLRFDPHLLDLFGIHFCCIVNKGQIILVAEVSLCDFFNLINHFWEAWIMSRSHLLIHFWRTPIPLFNHDLLFADWI